jgi:hypothetical protein
MKRCFLVIWFDVSGQEEEEEEEEVFLVIWFDISLVIWFDISGGPKGYMLQVEVVKTDLCLRPVYVCMLVWVAYIDGEE